MNKPALPTVPDQSAAGAIDVVGFHAYLRRRLEGEVRFDRVSRALYSTDASVYQIVPLGVIIPRSEQDVVATHGGT